MRNTKEQTIPFAENCVFCKMVRGEVEFKKVFEDEVTLTFLDHRPLFPGHCLLVTRGHYQTLADLPDHLIDPVFRDVRLLSRAVQDAMEAEGTFIAVNNNVSQSVPHFHVHIVPRRKGDGLKGFFWPRRAYKSVEEVRTTLNRLHAAIERLNTGAP